MQTWEMREAIISVYKDSPTWKKKVEKMSDAQVTAIYLRLLNAGRIK